MVKQPEVWLRGPIPAYPMELQPVAHAILQAQEEIHQLMANFPKEKLWEKPAGMASAAFHIRHIGGVLDRMCTYANAETLTEEQFAYLKSEGVPNQDLTPQDLLKVLNIQIASFLAFLENVDPKSLTEKRGVGRAQLPSTVGGLLFHAAEHMQRHFGQLLVTVKVIVDPR